MHGSLRIRYTSESQDFRRIDGRWYLASENNEPVDAPLHVVKKANLPYSHDFEVDAGDALRLELPSGQQIALWCSGTPFIGQAVGQGSLSISWGEKPFRSPPGKWRKLPDGGRGSDGYDSYIRPGGVTTAFSQPEWSQTRLFVGDYQVTLEETEGKEGRVALRVAIGVATTSERLHGDAKREYYVKQSNQVPRRSERKRSRRSII